MGKLVDDKGKVVVTFTELIKGHMGAPKHKKGFSNKDIAVDHGNDIVYNRMLFRLFELMIMDVIDGDIVYFNKKLGSKMYVDMQPASAAMIKGKGLNKRRVEKIDFAVTRYKIPFVAFDPGGKRSMCKVIIPMYLYNELIKKVNGGQKYPKGLKKFWFDK